MKKVLVLCTGNSCRSQMAEGFLNFLGVDVTSAGLESYKINPYAVKVMSEISIDISKNFSQKINTLNLDLFDVVITVCDHAKETCPSLFNVKKKIHRSFIDPAKFIGSEHEKILLFRSIRDQIQMFCCHFFHKYYII